MMNGPKKSIIPIAIADDGRLNRTALRVLILLGGYADKNGDNAWPSITTMASRLNVSGRFVRKSLREIEALGYIKRRAQFKDDGRQTSNSYCLVGPIYEEGGGTGSSGGEEPQVPGGGGGTGSSGTGRNWEFPQTTQ